MIVMFDNTSYKYQIKEVFNKGESSLFIKGIEIANLIVKKNIKNNIFKGLVDTKKRIEHLTPDEALMKVIEEHGKDGLYNLIFNNRIS